MGFINVAERTIDAKLVYYGVGVGGKTTSLQQVHGIFCPRNEVKLLSIDTEQDSTLLFDFLPINLGRVGGFKIRIQGFTVPGQPKYRKMRKYVLQGADAVVFVVDSQASRLHENLESLQSMRDNLRTIGGTSESIPIVLQYNKRDLPDILAEDELDRQFRFRDDILAFPSVATEGQGVFEAFVHAVGLLVEDKVRTHGLGRGQVDPAEVAAGARQKLWEICDEVRRERAVVPPAELPQTRLQVTESAPAEWQQPTLLDEVAPREPRPEPTPADASDDFIAYQLRDEAGAAPTCVRGDTVLADTELDAELAVGPVDFHAPPPPESESALLDQTVQSNLELARRYGELDEQRLLWERKVHELVEVTQTTVHDLRRPLSAMRLMLSTVDKGYLGEVSVPVRQAIQNGLLAVTQMDRLVRDLLDSSRLEHDGITLTFQDTDLQLLLADVVRTLRYELDERSVLVRIEPMPTVRCDGWAMTKVFMNLLGNAIAYGAPDRPPVIRVWADDAGDRWQVFVCDNGIGIPEQDRPRLFRRFERGSNTGGISGTGLGLHIVKEIVMGHGGSVAFTSEVGAGTTFVIHLPKRPVQAPHSPIAETAERADL